MAAGEAEGSAKATQARSTLVERQFLYPASTGIPSLKGEQVTSMREVTCFDDAFADTTIAVSLKPVRGVCAILHFLRAILQPVPDAA